MFSARSFTQHQLDQMRELNINSLFLFGSQAIHRAGLLSDTDIAVLLSKPLNLDQNLHKTVGLELLLSSFFSQYKNIQVTILNSAPIGLQLDVLNQGKLLFTADPIALADFREYVMRRAGDLRPFLRAFRAERLRNSYA